MNAQALGARLADAHRRRAVLPAFETDGLDLASAYAVQDAFCAMMEGEAIGWKVGATSAASMAAKGLAEPVSGRLFPHSGYASGVALPAKEFTAPYLEAEFAFRMARHLPPEGAPRTREEVAAAAGTMLLAVEVADSRLPDWRNTDGLSSIADNVCHGAVVFGPPVPDWRRLDLASWPVSLRVNGQQQAAGCGADVYGHPLEALRWLANHLAMRGITLKADAIVITGTCTGVVPVRAGDRAVADFGACGCIELSFVAA